MKMFRKSGFSGLVGLHIITVNPGLGCLLGANAPLGPASSEGISVCMSVTL